MNIKQQNNILTDIVSDIAYPLSDLSLRVERIRNPHFVYANGGKAEDVQQLAVDLASYAKDIEELSDIFYEENRFSEFTLNAGLAMFEALLADVQKLQERVSYELRGQRI